MDIARRIIVFMATSAMLLSLVGCQSTPRSSRPRLASRSQPPVQKLAERGSSPSFSREMGRRDVSARLARLAKATTTGQDRDAKSKRTAGSIPTSASDSRVAMASFQEDDQQDDQKDDPKDDQEFGESLGDLLDDLESDLESALDTDGEPNNDPGAPARLRRQEDTPSADLSESIRQPDSENATDATNEGQDDRPSESSSAKTDERTTAADNQPATRTGSAGPATAQDPSVDVLMDPMCQSCQPMTIDLSNALALAGANNQQIALARARVIEANADWLAAKATRLPTFKYGIGYTYHDGELQTSPGVLIDPTRSSLFIGGGNTLNDQITGESSGPANIGVNLSLADAFFKPLVARQLRDAVCAAKASTINDTLLAAGEAYFALVESYALLATTQQALIALDEVNRLTTDFAEAGKGSQAEVYRARTERTFWQRVLQDDWREINLARAELARRLSLECTICLYPVEEQIMPVELISVDIPCDQLISTAMRCRPEAEEQSLRVAAAEDRVRQEELRPFLPHFQIGTNFGLFGGDRTGFPSDYGLRKDIGAQATWELRNMGLGNKALRCQRVGQLKQQQALCGFVRDQICAEVKSALAEVLSFRQQIDLAMAGLETADQSYRANLERIREDEGIPLELLQAIRARHEAQTGLTEAITDYNQSQFRLLRAVGQSPDANTASAATYHEQLPAAVTETHVAPEVIVQEAGAEDAALPPDTSDRDSFFEKATDLP